MDYFPIRLQWNGRTGTARSRYTAMKLIQPPALPFMFAEIDYAPGACTLIRRRLDDRMEDMTAAEIESCRYFLAGLDAEPNDLEPDA